jgi:hypothetical protein
MRKVIFIFMCFIYLLIYQSYINRPPSDLEIFCGVYFKGVTEEIMNEPLGKALFEDCK